MKNYILLILPSFLFISCKNDEIPAPVDTDPNYSSVRNIINQNCTGCHYQDNDDGVSDLSSYSSIKIVLDNSSVDFKSRINSSDSDYRMPPSGLMSQNDINKLNDWIDSGYPE